MFEPTTENRITQFLNAPMVEWSDLQHGLFEETKAEMVAELDGIIIKGARLRAYMERRRNGTHLEAVKYSNDLAAKVRKALGYTQARHDITF